MADTRGRLALAALLLVGCAAPPPPPRPAPRPAPAPAAPARPVVRGGGKAAAPAPEGPGFDPAVVAEGNHLRVWLTTGRDVEGTSGGVFKDELVLVRREGQLRFRRAQVQRIERLQDVERPAPGGAAAKVPPPTQQKVTVVATLKRVGANMCWSPDGAAVYVALGGGQLTRRKRPEFQVERTVALGRRIRDLALCPRGLVVALQDPSELLVLDPVTLERRASIPMVIGGRPLDGYAAVAWVAASPAHPLVYAGNDRSVWTIDPAAGQIVASPDVRGGLTGGRLTLDGSYLFGSVGYDVARLRVEGDGLAFDGYTRHDPNGVMSRLDRVEVSPDGRHVAAPNSGPGYSSDIYDVSDLSQPVTRVTSGAYPEALGFDPRARRIYAQNHEYALLVFGMDGTHQATIIHPALTRRGCTARQLLVAPEGHRVLVLVGDIADGDDTLVWVELP